jgi:hypothetical protein
MKNELVVKAQGSREKGHCLLVLHRRADFYIKIFFPKSENNLKPDFSRIKFF